MKVKSKAKKKSREDSSSAPFLIRHPLVLVLSVATASAAILIAGYIGTGQQPQKRKPWSSGPRSARLPTSSSYLEIRPSNIMNPGLPADDRQLGVFLSARSAVVPMGTILTGYGDRDIRYDEIGDATGTSSPMFNPVQQDLVRVGDLWKGPVPHRVKDGQNVGHLFNDGATIDLPSPERGGRFVGIKGLRRLIRAYEDQSDQATNTEFVDQGNSWDMYATRDIEPGEELYFPRGSSYWVQVALYSEHGSPLNRLLLYLYNIEEQGGPERASGTVLYLDDEKDVLMVTKLDREAGEIECRELLQDHLGFIGKKGQAAMARAGIPASMTSFKDKLKTLIKLVREPPEGVEDDADLKGLAAAIQTEEDEGEAERLPTSTAYLEVMPSTIPGAGLGIFISPDSTAVKEGTVLTVYGGADMQSDEVIDTEYAIRIPGRRGVMRVGQPWSDAVPAKVEEGVPVGHIINDGAAVVRPPPGELESDGGFLSKKRLDQMVKEYDVAAVGRANVRQPKDPSTGNWDIVADRHIQPGEELFMAYGPMYWVGRLQNAFDDCPLSRLSVYLHLLEKGPGAHVQGEYHTVQTLIEQGDEESNRMFFEDRIGFAGMAGQEAMARAGVTPDMTYREKLKRVVDVVSE